MLRESELRARRSSEQRFEDVDVEVAFQLSKELEGQLRRAEEWAQRPRELSAHERVQDEPTAQQHAVLHAGARSGLYVLRAAREHPEPRQSGQRQHGDVEQLEE